MDNSLKKIITESLAGLSKAFHSDKNSDSSLGIDIGSSAIKIVQLKKKNGKAVLETYGAISLGPYANTDIGAITNLKAEDLSKALADLIKESNVTINSGAIAIPSSASLIFIISLPAKIGEEELASVVPIEARKYIPVPMNEVTLDWVLIPKEPESYNATQSNNNIQEESKQEVLVIAIHNEIVERYKEVLTKTALHPKSFEMEIFGNIFSSLGHDISPILLIDFGASKTKLSIIESGVVHVFHVVNRGSNDISRNIAQSMGISFPEAEKLKCSVGLDDQKNSKVSEIIRSSIAYIFSDINNVVFTFEKRYNKNISKVVLTGGGSLMSGLLEKAKENFSTEVIITDPFQKTEFPAFLLPILKTSGPEFSVALGLALRQLS